MSSKEKSSRAPLILGALIKIVNSSISSTSVSSVSTLSSTTTEKKPCVSISRLPKYLDPNLGLTGYLPPLNMTYETKMNQPWNIAPYFLDILTQSPGCDLSDCILLFGGLDPTHPDDFVLGNSVFEYHINYKKWRYYGCMLEPRCYHVSAQVDSFVYVTGGYSLLQRTEGDMVAVPSTDRLDIKNTMWSHCADMKTARAAHAMVAVKEYLYVFGGRDSNGNILASVELYNPHENTWTEISQLPIPLMGLSATHVRDKIWLVGGVTSRKPDHQNASVVATVYTFSPANKSWRTEQPLPGPHAYASCVSNSDSLWVSGGSHFSKCVLNKMLVSCPCIWQLSFHTKPRSWKKVGYLPVPTHAAAAVLCGDLLISLGGIHSLSENGTTAVQVFNTKTKSFEQSVKLSAKIVGASAVYFPRKALDDEGVNKNTIPHNEEVLKSSASKSLPAALQTKNLTSEESGSIYSEYELNKAERKPRNLVDPFQGTPESGSYDREPSTLQNSVSDFSKILKTEKKFKDVSSPNEINPQTLKPANLTVETQAKVEKSLPNISKLSINNAPETFIYVKELTASSTKQYVTTLEIPLNGKKIYRSHDSRESDFTETEGSFETESSESEFSGIVNFKLYSPPSKWKERSKKLQNSEVNS